MSEKLKPTIEAIILDMDGVITDSARLHAQAWKQMFDAFLEKLPGKKQPPLDLPGDYKRYIDGISRLDGVRAFLQSRNLHLPEGDPDDGPEAESVVGLGKRKNAFFLELVEKEGVDVFPDTLEMLKTWKKKGVKLAVISASQNCRKILESADLLHWFDVRVDGETARREQLPGKPAPDVFLRAMQELRASPEHTLVVEDAIAGVKAAKRGHFSLVIGVARNGEAEGLLHAGADQIVKQLTEIAIDMETTSRVQLPDSLPHALEGMQQIFSEIGDKKPVLFFDYDGTLTPIVDDPDAAILTDGHRQVLADLAEQFTVAIISGRGLADLRSKVRLDQLIYAGSHGFEISGPHGLEMQYAPGQEILPQLDEVEKAVKKQIQRIEGCEVERKKYAIAVHYRRVEKSRVKELKQAVREVLEGREQLKVGKGKKILEIKPNLDWHKGHALNWLLDKLDLARSRYQPIFIGDDITDEDALRDLRGTGILVGTHGEKTHANYRLNDTEEVYEFLARLRRWQAPDPK
jgi:alpha,alpha-trehalase